MIVFNLINWRASGEVGFGPTNGSSAGELAEHLPPNPDSRRPPRPGGRRRARGLAAGTVRGGLGYLRFVYSPPKRGEESSQRTRRWRELDSNFRFRAPRGLASTDMGAIDSRRRRVIEQSPASANRSRCWAAIRRVAAHRRIRRRRQGRRCRRCERIAEPEVRIHSTPARSLRTIAEVATSRL